MSDPDEPNGNVVDLTELRRRHRHEIEARIKSMDVAPMLASAMTKGQRLEHFVGRDAWAMEEKIDGQRMIVRVDNGLAYAKSRAGLNRAFPPHIEHALGYLPDGLYDGELCLPGGMSTDVTRTDVQSHLAFVVFDVLELLTHLMYALPYESRRELLVVAYNHIQVAEPGCTAVGLSASLPVSQEVLGAIWARGGEGAVIKRKAAPYQPGRRSPDWLKVKRLEAATVTILGFERGDTGIACGRTLVRDDAGREFSIKTPDNATIRQAVSRPESLIGYRLVIEHNGQMPSGAYRHPRFDHLAGQGE